MILLIAFGCIIALLGWLVITPVQLILHSTTHEYKLKWGWLLKAQLILLSDDLLISIGLPFYRKDFYPLHPTPSSKSMQKPKKDKRKASKKGPRIPLKTIKSILKTFKVRQFKLELDTDNYLTNAYLYPLFHYLDRGKGEWHINYNGRFELHLEMDNRPIRILYVLSRSIW